MMSETSSTPFQANLIDVLEHHAHARPDATALVFLQDGEDSEQTITFLELRNTARALAETLQNEGIFPGNRVILLFPSSLDFVIALLACQYVGAIAVPTYTPTRSTDTLDGIVNDCKPAIFLAAPEIKNRMAGRFAASACVTAVPWFEYKFEGTCAPQGTPFPSVDHDQCALLQYTSGSTGSPKGVMLSHRNLLTNLHAIVTHFGMTADTTMVSWLPLYHDMGLIGNVLGSLYAGQKLCFMAPHEFIQNPSRWLKAISKYKAFISGGPNFSYQLCVDRISRDELKALDLSHWKVAFNGAEPVRAHVLDQFSDKFYPSGFSRSSFQPCYGMAEASLLVTTCAMDEIPLIRHLSRKALENNLVRMVNRASQDATALVSCGAIIPGHQIAIIHPDHKTPVLEGEVGEIWIQGPSFFDGYWNKADLNSFAFDTPLRGDFRDQFFRTGDLGFISDGHLFVTGRLKDVIIIRGRNHYPQDIEACAFRSSHDFKADGAIAFEVEGPAGAELVIVQEVARSRVRSFDSSVGAVAIRGAVAAEFNLQVAAVVFLSPQALPRTSSGKVQRAKAKKLFLENAFEAIAIERAGIAVERDTQDVFPTDTDLQKKLREDIAQLMQIPPGALRLDRPLLEQGIDSLTQLRLAHLLKVKYGKVYTVENMFDGLSILEISDAIGCAPADLADCQVAKENESSAPDISSQHRRDSEADCLKFSMMYFSSDAAAKDHAAYDLFLKSLAVGDDIGLHAVWLPERHFHRFGGLFPNPSILGAVAATRTTRMRIRAGSVILPLHDPLRVAEEWGIVDNLSGGRVDLAFGQGWNPNDFVLSPGGYENRLSTMYTSIDTVKRLWRGDSIERVNGIGEKRPISIFPGPVQKELQAWITCSGGIDRFVEAGARGENVLTALLFQDLSDLETKIGAYRTSLKAHGHDPRKGRVTLMLHTFIGSQEAEVRQVVREPMLRYLEDSIDLWSQKSQALQSLGAQERATVLDFAFEKYYRSQSLCGTPETCKPFLERLHQMGVNEIACLIDFGVGTSEVLDSLSCMKPLVDHFSEEKTRPAIEEVLK
jgi:natural product biosynthesis luciferase-like monooxygenase protein